MISDDQTNFLFLADFLPHKYPSFYSGFEQVLYDLKINFEFLPDTKDVWAVDYMPVQLEQNKFVQFTYNPSYLQSSKYLKTISDADSICKKLGIKTTPSNLVLDGGNITRYGNKVIMTERVIKENSKYDRNTLLYKLHELLEVDKIFIIPEQPNDFTGHSDGMVRFVDDETIIVNDYKSENCSFRKAFDRAIQNTGLQYEIIPYNPYKNATYAEANGDYINYLQMENVVIVPVFGLEEDEQAIRQFEKIFAGQLLVTLPSNEIANAGGVLNCITWNILK